jgi:hypothetical protein
MIAVGNCHTFRYPRRCLVVPEVARGLVIVQKFKTFVLCISPNFRGSLLLRPPLFIHPWVLQLSLRALDKPQQPSITMEKDIA